MFIALFQRHYKAIVGIALFVVFTSLAVLNDKQVNYPVVRILSNDLNTTIVMRPVANIAECHTTLSNISSTVHSACPTCNTSASHCTNSLTAQETLLLSGKPLPHFSAQLPNGVALYEFTTSSKAAEEACQQSELQSTSKGFAVHCYPPNTERDQSLAIPSIHSYNQQGLWVILAILTLVFLAFQLTPTLSTLFGQHALNMPRKSKQALVLLSDLVALELSFYLAMAIRFESLWVPTSSLKLLMLLSPLMALPIFLRFGLYRAIMRYVGLQAMATIAKAVALYTALLTLMALTLTLQNMPLSVLWIHGLLTLLLIGTSRTVARKWLSQAQTNQHGNYPRKRTIIFGAGSAGVQLALALAQSREIQPIAFVDDDQTLH